MIKFFKLRMSCLLRIQNIVFPQLKYIEICDSLLQTLKKWCFFIDLELNTTKHLINCMQFFYIISYLTWPYFVLSTLFPNELRRLWPFYVAVSKRNPALSISAFKTASVRATISILLPFRSGMQYGNGLVSAAILVMHPIPLVILFCGRLANFFGVWKPT